MSSDKIIRRIKRSRRIKARLARTDLPRLIVHRSLQHIYGQIIDDNSGKVLISASTLRDKKVHHNIAGANQVGAELGSKAFKMGITKVKFDRRGYKYHGQVKAFAEGARSAGLIF